jgi:hypothetical protein
MHQKPRLVKQSGAACDAAVSAGTRRASVGFVFRAAVGDHISAQRTRAAVLEPDPTVNARIHQVRDPILIT